MKNRCKDFGELSPANRLAGCMNIDINCTGLRARYARKANRTATNQKRKPPIKAKSSRFDNLVARYYPAVYSFACRFTDDSRKARVLTRQAFNSTRKQLQTCCDENVLASILISNVIRAGCLLESKAAQTAQLQRRNNNFGRHYGAHGRTVTGHFKQTVSALCDSMTHGNKVARTNLNHASFQSKYREHFKQVKQKPPCDKADIGVC
jgi:hypothetical protein